MLIFFTGQSKNKVKEAVEELVLLQARRALLESRVERLEDSMQDSLREKHGVGDAQARLEKARTDLKTIRETVRTKHSALGTLDGQALDKLKFSEYLGTRLNARSVKEKLRQMLRERKFELAVVERVARRHTNDSKKAEHTQAAITRRQPNIAANAKTYNTLCEKLKTLITGGKAPPNVVCPRLIPRDRLFCLDVDDDIWQDVGLDDDESGPLPPWLSNLKVREGIRGILELDRCNEEAGRISHERDAMQEWFSEEWKVLNAALQTAGIYFKCFSCFVR